MKNLSFLYITNSSEEEAKKIARHLLEKRMIGCANIYPISAMYWWEDKIIDDNEWVLIVKTPKQNTEKVRKEVAKIHPFDTPCIIKIDADPNEKYMRWILKETKI